MHDTKSQQLRKSRVALLSVVSNTLLTGGKLAVGLLIGSVSVISEAIHSGVDLLAAVIAWFSVRTSGKPADPDHPFGHGKIENISGTIEALLIFLAGIWIIYEAVLKLMHREPLDAPLWGIVIMLVSAVANFIVSRRLFMVGKETDSMALMADGWHLRTDVWTSAGVMAGLTVILGGRWLFPRTPLDWVDPVAAIAVALLILHTAWKLTVEAGRDLLDASLPKEEEAWIRAFVRSAQDPMIRGIHHLRTRKAGSARFVEFHLRVEGNRTVEESHRLARDLSAGIRARYPHTGVTIHVEPCAEAGCDHRACDDGCRVTPASR